jgi:hypothetical protein
MLNPFCADGWIRIHMLRRKHADRALAFSRPLQGLNQLIWYDLNGSSLLTQQRVATQLTGDKEILQARRPGFAYDPVNDVYVAWSGEYADSNGDGVIDVSLPPENVYVIDPVTWAAKKITPAATNTVKPRSPFALSNGFSNSTFGRFSYIPSKNVFILVNNWPSEKVFFYKLDPVQIQSWKLSIK